MPRTGRWLPFLVALLLLGPGPALAAGGASDGPELLGIRVELILFALTLLGVALLHHHTLWVGLSGLTVILGYKLLAIPGFDPGAWVHHEWQIVLNLLGLLLGFALLSKHFEESRVPEKLPAILPDGRSGALALLVIVAVLSTFLDNIAAAMIGGTMARVVFKGRVHVGYLAAIVAASNAGGAPSVVGDTTTTMMWISGVAPGQVVEAAVGAVVAVAISGVFAARQQHLHQPIARDALGAEPIDWARLLIVAAILVGAIVATWTIELTAVGVWAAILLGAALRKPDWSLLPGALKGAVFLLSLVACASLMPVEKLPAPSWGTAFGLGWVSAVFDNIPLTKLALEQNGYDWGFLAFAVGYGGSMIWFGSSAGVALSTTFPEARSTARWVRHGWHVALAYAAAFLTMLALLGWHPVTYTKRSAPHADAASPGSGALAAETSAR